MIEIFIDSQQKSKLNTMQKKTVSIVHDKLPDNAHLEVLFSYDCNHADYFIEIRDAHVIDHSDNRIDIRHASEYDFTEQEIEDLVWSYSHEWTDQRNPSPYNDIETYVRFLNHRSKVGEVYKVYNASEGIISCDTPEGIFYQHFKNHSL